MKTPVQVGTLTLERLRADIEQGIVDDRPETFAPPEAYDPPTEREAQAAGVHPKRAHPKARAGGTAATNGSAIGGRTSKDRARKEAASSSAG